MEGNMDFDTWVLIEQGMLDQKESNGKEEDCFTCAAFPCRCDDIYDAWRDDRAYI